MIEFDYKLDYKKLYFTDKETRKLYRIGRGEQGVLLVRPYLQQMYLMKILKKQVLKKYIQCMPITEQKMILLVWICVESF